MEFIKRQVSYVMRLSVGEKIGLLFVFIGLNENVERSYAKLGQEAANKTPVAGHHQNRKQSKPSDPSKLELSSAPFRWQFKVYIWFTNYVLSVNLVKYILVALNVELKLGPSDWNCYLPGRLFAANMMVDVSLVLSIFLVILILAWQNIAKKCEINHELLQMLMFLVSDDDQIKREQCRVQQINNNNKLIRGSAGSSEELSSLLQKALFYKLTTSDGSMVYKLRPNRTSHYKRQLAKYVDIFYISFLGLGLTFMLVIIPLATYCWLTDHSYAKTYPTCCPAESQFWLLDDESFRMGCGQRLYTILFDVVDSSTLLVGSALIYLSTFTLSISITASLVLHWRAIDRRIRHLARLYKQQRQVFASRTDLLRLPISSRKSFKRAQANGFDRFEYEKSDLQAQIIDYFRSFKKINRLAGSLVGYLFLAFFNNILTFAYFSFMIPGYYRTLLAQYAMAAVYAIFFANSLLVLELNRVLNKSYPNICSLMAADGTMGAVKWLSIVDIYADRLDTSYSVLGWRLNWHLITSMLASSLSFLFVVETYKRKRTELPGS